MINSNIHTIKIKAIYLFLLLPLLSIAQHQYTDKPSVHGMLLMGNKTLYASHLPMFHSPHDYQIILKLKLGDQEQTVYMADKQKYPDEKVYTLAPEVFVLPKKIEEGGSFKATIYRGHFERGGTKILENIQVEISDVVYNQKFEKDTKRPEFIKYLLFGNSEEQFLAHLISKKPDFDEIIQVSFQKNDQKSLKDNKFLTIEFREKEKRTPFSWVTEKGKIISTNESISLTKIKTLYLEYGDLD